MTRSIEEIELAIDLELMDSLPELDFAEALPDLGSPEEFDKSAPSVLRYLLQTGDKGYKDGIDAVIDAEGNPPSQENNWLYSPEAKAFQGRFVDQRPGSDRIFEFTIQMGTGDPIRTFRPISGVE